MPVRMFVAVVPPADVLEDLEEFVDPRREAAPFRWTRPEGWHLTLAFMAAVPDRALDDHVERLGRAAHRRTPMTLALAGAGAFPSVSRARVLYAGVDGTAEALEELRRTAVGARAAATKAGAAPDGARFKPHLTLARLNRPVEATRWLRTLAPYRSRDFTVDEDRAGGARPVPRPGAGRGHDDRGVVEREQLVHEGHGAKSSEPVDIGRSRHAGLQRPNGNVSVTT